MHQSVIFSFVSTDVCSPAIFEACFSLAKIYGLLQLIIICTLT